MRKATPRSAVLSALAVISGAWILPPAAVACTCSGPSDLAEIYDGSDAVFIAKVAEVCDFPDWYYRLIELIDQRFDTGLIWQVDEPLVHLDVETSWKGITAAHAVTRTSRAAGGCGYPFVEGRRYLIYAVERQGHLGTGLCWGTKRVSSAAADLDFLAGFPLLPQPESRPLPLLSRTTRCWSHWQGWWFPFARWAGLGGLTRVVTESLR